MSKEIISFKNSKSKNFPAPPYILYKEAGTIGNSIAQAGGFAQEDFKIAQKPGRFSTRSPSFYKKRKNLKKPLDKAEATW